MQVMLCSSDMLPTHMLILSAAVLVWTLRVDLHTTHIRMLHYIPTCILLL